jgi:hypothetical protein
MVLHLPFDGSEKSLAWARAVVAKNPGTPTIVSTHCYLCPGGNPFPDNPAAGRLGGEFSLGGMGRAVREEAGPRRRGNPSLLTIRSRQDEGRVLQKGDAALGAGAAGG